jgi:hypothetical protein
MKYICLKEMPFAYVGEIMEMESNATMFFECESKSTSTRYVIPLSALVRQGFIELIKPPEE